MSKQLQVSRLASDRHGMLAELPDMMLAMTDTAERDRNWNELARFEPKPNRLANARVVTAGPQTPASAAFDISRTKLVKMAREHNWRFVGITSPRSGAGKTTFAMNLAYSLARQPEYRVALLDLDLGRPQIAQVLDLPEMASVERFLGEDVPARDAFVRCDTGLAVCAGRARSAYPAAVLQGSKTKSALRRIQQTLSPQLVLFDMPSMIGSDEVLCFLPYLDAVILVASADASTLAEVDCCEQELATQTNVAGVILNKCRYASDKYRF